MKTVKVQELSVEKFHRYGSYGAMINPDADATGPKDGTLVFYRDMVVPRMFETAAAFSTLLVRPRELVINVGEFHNHTSEVAMPLDGDALVWVAPCGGEAEVPVDQIEVFRVPKGTAFAINPGVWHHAAYCIEGKVLNMLIVLPERTYVNDCNVAEIPADKQVRIEFP